MADQTVSFLPRRGAAALPGRGVGRVAPAWPVWIYLFTVFFQIGFQIGPLTLTSLRLFLMVMIVPLYVNLLSGRYGRVYATDILFPLYILWTAIAIEVNNPGQTIELVGSTGVEFLGGYVMARAFIRTPEAFEALIRVLLIFVVLTAPLAIFETLTGRPLLVELIRGMGFNSVGNVQIEKRMGLERVQLSFAHPIHYGLFCSTVFGLTFVALKGSLSTAARYAGSAVVLLCVFVSLSSGALLALVLQVMLIVWATVFARMKARWYLLLGLTAVAYVVIDLLSNRTPIEVFMSYATFSAHNAYWRSLIFEWGMKNVWANPIFGIGLNEWVRPFYMYSGSMDNFWLLQTVRHGIPGFLLLATGYILGLALVMRRDFSADPRLRQIRLSWVIVFFGMTFTLSTVAIWTNIFSFVFFLYGAGFWLIVAQPAGTAPAAPAPPPRGGGHAPRRAAARDEAAAPTPADPAAAGPGDAPPGPRYTRFPPVARASAAGPSAES
jgi:hypothetical protein